MIYDKVNHQFVLSTGRTFYAFDDVIGLGQQDFYVHTGYDDLFYASGWTQIEREELADAMIQRWQDWKNKA